MKIAINLIPFKINPISDLPEDKKEEILSSGIEMFTRNLVLHLLKLAKKEQEFILITGDCDSEIREIPNGKIVQIKGLSHKYIKAFYQQSLVYPLLRKYKIDLLFSPTTYAPLFYKNKVIVIHDCAYNRFKEFDKFFSKLYFRAMFYGAKYFSRKIITVSNFSKKELIELYKIKPEKIEVIYEGIPEMPKVSEGFINETLKKFHIEKPYFLYIGNWRPRKNLPGLIKAFKIFKEKTKLDYLLVMGGKKDKRFLDLEKEIKKNNLEGNVLLTDTLTRKEIVALYTRSFALTFPSFYEGFGLPVLEAQSLGMPVLTSNTSSLPEVGGNSVLYVDPYNVEEIAKGMEKIVFDEALRQDLIEKGYQNIKRFSWEKSAEKLLSLFHAL